MLISPDTTAILSGGTLAIVILKIVFDLVKPVIQKPSNGESAGAQNKNYWILTFGQICKDSLMPICDILVRLERNQTEMMALLQKIRADQRRRAENDEEL